ncbi:MAG: hypothetical protein RLZZ502_1906 [Pseudomonadota bacterium]|jgi:hypothetical protein
MRVLCFLTALFLSACASLTAPTVAESEALVWQRVGQLNHAIFNTREAAVMQALVGEPVSYGHSDGRLENKAQMVKNASESANRYRNQKTERVSMHVQGRTAITRHTFSALQTNAQGVEAPLKISVLQTWVREREAGEQWLLKARQAVRLP